MIKRSASRNSKPKGIKLRHVLQIFLLLGICFWLLYQVKHSHEKKKEYEEKGARLSTKTQSEGRILKLGRKDLKPREKEVTTNKKHEEEEEEETKGDEEERKNEDEDREEEQKNNEDEGKAEEEQQEDQKNEGQDKEEEEEEQKNEGELEQEKDEEDEQKNEGEEKDGREEDEAKHEEAEDGETGVGDDEIDENDQEKMDRDEDFVDEVKEKEEGSEEETENTNGEEKEGQTEEHENSSSKEQYHDDGGNEKTHEAREENYKGDDASSAVAHDTHSTNPEEVSLENSNVNLETSSQEQDNKISTAEEIDGTHNSSRLTEEKIGIMNENGTSTDGNSTNPEMTTQSNDQVEASNNNSTLRSTETSDFPQQVEKETLLDSAHTLHTTVDNTTAESGIFVQNLQVEQANTSSDTILDSNHLELNSTDPINAGNANGDEGESSSLGISTSEDTSSTQHEEHNSNRESNAVEEDPIDSSDSHVDQDMKETRVDLDTLPEVRTAVNNIKEIAED